MSLLVLGVIGCLFGYTHSQLIGGIDISKLPVCAVRQSWTLLLSSDRASSKHASKTIQRRPMVARLQTFVVYAAVYPILTPCLAVCKMPVMQQNRKVRVKTVAPECPNLTAYSCFSIRYCIMRYLQREHTRLLGMLTSFINYGDSRIY